MTPKEMDDVTYKLKEIFTIYGKDISDQVCALWVRSLSGKDPNLILKAFDEYAKEGKYAPKPVDIIELVDRIKVEVRARISGNFKSPKGGNPEIAAAWIAYIRQAHGFPLPASMDPPGAMPMSLDDALPIVQREAIKYRCPEALLQEHRFG